MEPNRDSRALRSLLSILKNKNPRSSIASLVNAATIDLICQLLTREDYDSFAAQTNFSDAMNLLDFILYLLHDPRLTNMNGTVNIKRRARRFMLKIVTKTSRSVIPESLVVTGIKIPPEEDHIGQGGFGRVFKGKLGRDIVALKVLHRVDNKNIAFCQEALIWRSLRHKFVLPFLGIYKDEPKKHFLLVSPYMTNGTLAQWRREKKPSIAEVKERILEVAEGIEYIHSEGVVHGDLRGANVLLDANLHVKIADFGLTRVLEATNSRSRTRHFNFAAPELFGIDDDEDFEPIRTQKSDVYAFGCLYYEIHHDAMPFAGKTEMIIVKHHAQGLHPRRLQEPPLSDEAWELIRSCWTRKPSDRPGIEEVTEKMVAISQSVVSTPASSTRALESGTPSLLNELVEHTLQSPTPRAPLCPTNALGPPLVRPSMHSASWMPATCSPLSATAGAQGPSYPGAPLLPPNGAGLPYKLSTQPSPRTQPKAPGIEGVMEMVTRCSLSCPDPAICNSLGIHLAHLSTSPAQSPSTSSPTSSFKTPASSFTPASPPNSRHNSWLPVEQRSQLRRQSGSAIIAQDPSYGMPPGAPRSASPLSATLKASLEYYSSPQFGNLGFQFPTAQQSDECTDVLTVWQNVTLNPSFKDTDLNRLYNEVISRAKYDGTKIVLKTDDVLRISLAFTIEW